jgi:hypothetical protein
MAEPRQKNEIVAFRVRRNTTCSECGAELLKGSLIRVIKNRALCLDCADLGHLEYLPRGDTAVTRRSAKHSILWVVVVEWSRSRNRYERQGILAEPAAIEIARAESEADEETRARHRAAAAVRREKLDHEYVARFAEAVRRDFPAIPGDVEIRIAEHACLKHSGRVGRSAAAKEFSPEAIFLAVQAHIRHCNTKYDELLFKYDDRSLARDMVRDDVESVLTAWKGNA